MRVARKESERVSWMGRILAAEMDYSEAASSVEKTDCM